MNRFFQRFLRGKKGSQSVSVREKIELADKPGSVRDSHSSGIDITINLKQPTRTQCEPHRRVPIWPCSKRGLPCHELLPVARCALTAPFHPYRRYALRRSTLCCTFRGLSPPRRYLALCSLEPGLSSTWRRNHSKQSKTSNRAATAWPARSKTMRVLLETQAFSAKTTTLATYSASSCIFNASWYRWFFFRPDIFAATAAA